MAQGFTKGVPVDTDINLSADSNLLVPSQHAIKTYVDNKTTGSVSSVTATSPVVSSGGSAPNISMPAANSSTDGYLKSTDYNTFNNKPNRGFVIAMATAL
jgi:hypothetical protein